MNPNFTYYESNSSAPKLWMDALRLDPEKFSSGQFEWWYTDGHFSDGSTFIASYHIEVNEDGNLVPYIRFSFSQKGKVIQDEIIVFKKDEIRYDKNICNIKIGNHFLKAVNGFDTYEIFVDPTVNNGNGLHLILERNIPIFAPDSYNELNSNTPYFHWMCAVPNGKLSGTITLNGIEKEVKGNGYHDHNWGNCPMSVLANDWHSARGQAEGFTAVTSSVRLKNGITLNNIYVAHPDKGILVAETMQNVEFLEGGKILQPDTEKYISSDSLHFVYGETSGYVRFKGKEVLSSFIFDEDQSYEWWYTRFDANLIIDLSSIDAQIKVKGHGILENLDFLGKRR